MILQAGCNPTVSNLGSSGGSLSLLLLSQEPQAFAATFAFQSELQRVPIPVLSNVTGNGLSALTGICLNPECSPSANLTALLSKLMNHSYICEHNRRKIKSVSLNSTMQLKQFYCKGFRSLFLTDDCISNERASFQL